MKAFDFNTIENFDEHINLSIPDYGYMIEHVINFSSYFIKQNSSYYDIGCSTGVLLNRIKEKNKHILFKSVGIDKSENLANTHKDIIVTDINKFEFNECDFITIIFTLQFLKYEERKKLLIKLYNVLQINGAVIICEKFLLKDGFFQDLFTFSYYDYKSINFTEQEIMRKQFDLRYIMTPISEKENLKLFQEVGFTKVESFWQSLQFKGWLLIK